MMGNKRFSKRDLERNEDPEAIAGAVAGATSAGLVSGIGLAALGPLGAIAGALAGAVGGWWAGKEFQHAMTEMDRAENQFRQAHEHAGATRPYEEARHGYQLGYLAGRNPDYADANFSVVEDDLRAAWVQAHLQDPKVRWEEVRGDARVGYEVARER
jgi:uncharacterized protein YcfJ